MHGGFLLLNGCQSIREDMVPAKIAGFEMCAQCGQKMLSEYVRVVFAFLKDWPSV